MKGCGRVLIQCASPGIYRERLAKITGIVSHELNPELPGYEAGSLPNRPQSSTSGRLRILFHSQETDASSFLCQGHGCGRQCVLPAVILVR